MFELFTTKQFREWLASRDPTLKGRIAARLRRLELGHFGDVNSVGDGVSELRFHFGAGYRVYIAQRGSFLVVLLCGGDKSSQHRDIRNAKALLAELETVLPWVN